MKKTLHFFMGILLPFLISSKANCQYYYYNNNYYESPVEIELGASIGAMNCLADIGGRSGPGKRFIKDINWKNTQFCGGAYVSALYNGYIGFRLETCFGQVKAYDSILQGDHSEAHSRYLRNLHFRSSITEASLLIEFNPLIAKSNWSATDAPAFSPYLLAGIGYYGFNPQAALNNIWIDLQPLHTEGEGFKEYPARKPYSLAQVNFPVGIGIKYELSTFVNLRFEMVYRFLLTDYLDDVSTQYADPSLFDKYLPAYDAQLAHRLADRQREIDPTHITHPDEIRGDPKNNDAYFSFNLKVGLILSRKRKN